MRDRQSQIEGSLVCQFISLEFCTEMISLSGGRLLGT